MSSVVIIPTTGAAVLKDAVHSVLAQSVGTRCYVVCDGNAHRQPVDALLQGLDVTVCHLPINVGANGHHGHRIYAAFAHLVDEEFVFFLDQDNWYAPSHVQRCVGLARASDLAWVHSLRTIVDSRGRFVCRDDCESLGRWPGITGTHAVDTSAFCVRRQALVKIAHAWHGPWGQDRIVTALLMQHFPRFGSTGAYTLHYRLGSNARSVDAGFFHAGNRTMAARHGATFPWARADASAAVASGS